MSKSKFMSGPWLASHGAYEASAINIRPAPEFATAETLVASLYRSLGFPDASEGSVPTRGREFDRQTLSNEWSESLGSSVTGDTWRTILHGILESPKQPNQSAKRFLQLCPVVPDVALYSGSARLSKNSWNPGTLIQRMVELGSSSEAEANQRWTKLLCALEVGSDDDIWARWLQREFELRRRAGLEWKAQELSFGANFPPSDKAQMQYPARQFVRDVEAVVDAKSRMTRRQWVSLLESIVRLASVTHVLWQCDVNYKLASAARQVLDGGPVPQRPEIASSMLSLRAPHLIYANPAVSKIRDYAARYLQARILINLLLWHLESLDCRIEALSSSKDIEVFLASVNSRRTELVGAGILSDYQNMLDAQARVLACKKGIGSNMIEFCRHVLGQRSTASETLRGYDQGYYLRKTGRHAAAPWIVALGPVSVLTLVHCCLQQTHGPRSVQYLCAHLGRYGLEVDRDDIASGDLGKQLRMLGLVLDSPDAETGMLLVPPFAVSQRV